MAALEQADVEITVLVGSAGVPLARLMTLSRGDVVTLDRGVSGPVSLLANGREIAKADVTLIGDRVAAAVSAPT
ncbi:MAG: FliM/FliN family flagellar motor switch protein [Parvularculaceae bacterium]